MEEEFEMLDGGQAWENITFIYVGEHKSVGVKWENKNPGSGKKREREGLNETPIVMAARNGQ